MSLFCVQYSTSVTRTHARMEDPVPYMSLITSATVHLSTLVHFAKGKVSGSSML